MRHVRFRRALSVAINRDEPTRPLPGPGQTLQNDMERSELFKPEYATKWAKHDPKLANKLLDEVGLNKRGSDGVRRCPMVNRQPSWSSIRARRPRTDALQLIGEFWKKVGIRMLTKPQTLENFRLRAFRATRS